MVRVGPPAQAQAGFNLADGLAKLPRVPDAARRADRLVAAEDDEPGEAVLAGSRRVGEAEVERVLGGEERDDTRAIDVGPEVGDEVAQVVFFLRADGAVGEAHEGVAPRQRPDRVVGVDPRAHAGVQIELRARRAQLRGDDQALATLAGALERLEEACPHPGRIVEVVGLSSASP